MLNVIGFLDTPNLDKIIEILNPVIETGDDTIGIVIGIIVGSMVSISFLGAGGKNILNQEISSNLVQKNDLIQNPKEKEEKEEIPIAIKISQTTSNRILREGQRSATLLYQVIDPESGILRMVNLSRPGVLTSGYFGNPPAYRKGILIDTYSPQGRYIEPEKDSWFVDGVWRHGVVCPAHRYHGIKFTDGIGRDIVYRNNKMLVPKRDERQD